MTCRRVSAIVHTVLVACLLLLAPTPAAAQHGGGGPNGPSPPPPDFWVATWGSDSVHYSTPCTQTNPFQTLDHARTEVQAYRAAYPWQTNIDIVVHIAGG